MLCYKNCLTSMQVERVLPDWLRFPVLIKDEEVRDFSSIMSLDPRLVQKLKENGVEDCFPGKYLSDGACVVYE